MALSLVKQVQAGDRTAQELKNSHKPYKRTKQQELLDDDAISVL